jgi:septum formation protein
MTLRHPIILASASPRRAELLTAAGIRFDVQPAHVDESVHDGESAQSYVKRVAAAKARAVFDSHPQRLVLAADTSVVVDGVVLGKPHDAAEARQMLRTLSGRLHEVMTAVVLASARGLDVALATTTVEFAPLSDDEIAWYVDSGEPMDKAGAYGIQGLASRFVTRIDGSYSNVVGLPVALVYEMLTRA